MLVFLHLVMDRQDVHIRRTLEEDKVNSLILFECPQLDYIVLCKASLFSSSAKCNCEETTKSITDKYSECKTTRLKQPHASFPIYFRPLVPCDKHPTWRLCFPHCIFATRDTMYQRLISVDDLLAWPDGTVGAQSDTNRQVY